MNVNNPKIAFQPIYSLDHAKVLGREAFLRSDIPPQLLFEMANTREKIINLDKLSRSLTLALFNDTSEKLFMNCHPTTLLYDDALIESLRDHPLVGNIIIEITEQQRLDDLDLAVERVALLRSLGTKIALDDFGEGFSNFTLIEKLRPDYIKLDKKICANIVDDDFVKKIVQGLVAFSRITGIDLIAEGIETNEQRLLIQESGIGLGQGFLLGRPKIVIP